MVPLGGEQGLVITEKTVAQKLQDEQTRAEQERNESLVRIRMLRDKFILRDRELNGTQLAPVAEDLKIVKITYTDEENRTGTYWQPLITEKDEDALGGERVWMITCDGCRHEVKKVPHEVYGTQLKVMPVSQETVAKSKFPLFKGAEQAEDIVDGMPIGEEKILYERKGATQTGKYSRVKVEIVDPGDKVKASQQDLNFAEMELQRTLDLAKTLANSAPLPDKAPPATV